MADLCDTGNTHPVFGQGVHYGTPQNRVVRLQCRIDGILQDVPEGYHIPDCMLPLAPDKAIILGMLEASTPTAPPLADEYPIFINVVTGQLWLYLVTDEGSGWFPQVDTYKSPSFGAARRNVSDKALEFITVNDFVQPADGASRHQAVGRMAAALGYVIFGTGIYPLQTCTIAVPMFFHQGAKLSANFGHLITISNVISSPKQYIFQGTGNYAIGYNSDTGVGENSTWVHASWCGIFPNANGDQPDQAPLITRAFSWMGNSRESIIQFDMGNYRMETTAIVSRAGWVKGAGTRRTVFKSYSDTNDVFVTEQVACKFSGIQHELADSVPVKTAGAFIRTNTTDCEIYDIDLRATAALGIVIGGQATRTRIRNIQAVYGDEVGAGSSLLAINSGDCIIDTVVAQSSQFGPTDLINIGFEATTSIADITINNVSSVLPSTLVHVQANNFNISRVNMTNLQYNGHDGTPPKAIRLSTVNGTNGAIFDVAINNVQINAYAATGIAFDQDSNGSIQGVQISETIVSGSSGTGISFSRTAGFIAGYRIGDTFDADSRGALAITYSGTNIGQSKVAPMALPNCQPSYNFGVNIADDDVYVVDMHRDIYTSNILVSIEATEYAQYVARASDVVPGVGHIDIGHTTNMAYLDTPLTGTDGVDGQFTCGLDGDGKFYFENRLGRPVGVTITINTGVQ